MQTLEPETVDALSRITSAITHAPRTSDRTVAGPGGGLICPQCSREVLAADINIGEGVALCRACSKISRLSEMSEAIRPLAEPGAIPQGCSIRADGPATVLCTRTRSVPGAAFCGIFWAFWTGIVSIFLLFAISATWSKLTGSQPSGLPVPKGITLNGHKVTLASISAGQLAFLWCFLTPFILVSLGMLYALLCCIWGRVEVRIEEPTGTIFAGVGSIGWRQRFDLNAVKSVGIGRTRWMQNNQTKPQIVILADREVRLGAGLSDDRRRWLAASLQQVLVPK